MEEEKVDISKHIELHFTGKPVSSIKPMKNNTYKVFSKAKDDIRIIDRDANLVLLNYCPKMKKFTIDKEVSHRYFYSIPINSPNGEYVGFIYRTVLGKTYSSVYRPFKDNTKKIPYLYGFFNDFQTYNRHTTCMPIVVCEGVKDAIMMKKMYPYSVSCNGSRLGISAHILANITDKIILAYDNDKTGDDSKREDKKILSNLGCSVDVLNYDEGFKDMADYVSHPQEMREIRNQLKLKLKGLIFGTTLA